MMRLDRETARRRATSGFVRPQLALATLSAIHVGFALALAKLGHAIVSLTDSSRGSLLLLGVAGLILLAPIVSRIWAAASRWALEPSTAAKLSLGLVLLAIAGLCLGVGVEWSDGATVDARALGAGGVTLILAATCFGLASLTAVDELARADQRRTWLAIWSLTQLLTTLGVSLAERHPPAPAELFESSVTIGLACVAAAVGLAFAWRPLDTIAAELATDHDELEPRSALVVHSREGLV